MLPISHDSKIKLKVGDYEKSTESIFVVDYLREYKSIFETALANESVDPGENLLRPCPYK
jgi:hypothetical protein